MTMALASGNTLGGLVGVLVHDLLGLCGLSGYVWLASALAVSLTIVVQELTRTVHPPGGATALIYVTTPLVQQLGYKYVFCPSFLGAVWLAPSTWSVFLGHIWTYSIVYGVFVCICKLS